MAEKHPADRRSVVVTLRLTPAERTWLLRQRTKRESISDALRRLLFAPRPDAEVEKLRDLLNEYGFSVRDLDGADDACDHNHAPG